MAVKTGTFKKGWKYFRAKCTVCQEGKSNTNASLVRAWTLKHSDRCGKNPGDKVDWEV